MSLATDKISDYLTRYERGDHAGSSKPSYTTQEVSDLLLRSHYSANGKGVTDHAATLTYSFPVYTDSDKTGAAQLTAAQQAQTKLSLQSWSDVANITFTEVKGNDAKNADIKFGFIRRPAGAITPRMKVRRAISKAPFGSAAITATTPPIRKPITTPGIR